MEKKIEVGVLGATGMVGQQFVNQLRDHPWFDLSWLGASERSAGKPYHEAANWTQNSSIPEAIASRGVHLCKPESDTPRLVFSALDASVAGEIEQAFAAAGHAGLIAVQRNKRGWSGAIVTNPNCSTIAMVMGLAPLKPFGIKKVLASTMQAISGAGYPGLPSMDITANVIPYIGGEEEKMQQETLKLLGDFKNDRVELLDAVVSAHCNRVGVVDGHTIAVSVELEQQPSIAELEAAFVSFRGAPQEKNLPTAPKQPVHLMRQADRPQPRRDALIEGGMAVSVGRVRECPVLDYKFVVLGHNTIRGAAGAAVLNAELMLTEGLLD